MCIRDRITLNYTYSSLMLEGRPSFKVDLYAGVSIDAWVAKVGGGLVGTVVEAALPMKMNVDFDRRLTGLFILNFEGKTGCVVIDIWYKYRNWILIGSYGDKNVIWSTEIRQCSQRSQELYRYAIGN
eukprot:TRINITY_DN0_c710_g1_i1.p1 TRINITY_DN0_c710_g1~~TRINITY_DN0_c710_g1_i1.p1  ORF type:complete len:127 (-),score=7.70 TRINITY_DN0_c710_g1_i1:40-420(-)